MTNRDILLFHDIHTKSGFQSKSSIKYKIKAKKFYQLIGILKRSLKKDHRPQLTFDDGGNSINQKVLSDLKNDFQITLFIATNYIDKKGFLSSKDLKKIFEMGISIGSHSHNHIDMRILKKEEFIADWVKSKSNLEKLLKAEISSCSIPFGKYYDWQLIELTKIGFKCIFTSDNYELKITENIKTISRIPVDSRFYMFEFFFLKLFNVKYLKFRFHIAKTLKRWI